MSNASIDNSHADNKNSIGCLSTSTTEQQQQQQQQSLHPAVAAGLGTFVLLNVGALFSLPPVLMGRGAPYLPTFAKNMDAMFHQLKNEPKFIHRVAIRNQYRSNSYNNKNNDKKKENFTCSAIYHPSLSSVKKSLLSSIITFGTTNLIPNNNINQQQLPTIQQQLSQETTTTTTEATNKLLIFVDLGSGDGRLVYRAAQENIFDICIGYEINPFLHVLACLQKPMYNIKNYYYNLRYSIKNDNNVLPTTKIQFYLGDLWNVNLQNADVVAIYGLGPIMKELGGKLKHELKPGSYVLSNIFSIPDWKPVGSSAGTYIYIIPDE